MTWSANTRDRSNWPTWRESSKHRTRCVGLANCFAGDSFEPEESVTYRRPWSSKLALTGRDTRSVPAASSTMKPSGTVNRRSFTSHSAAAAGGLGCAQYPQISRSRQWTPGKGARLGWWRTQFMPETRRRTNDRASHESAALSASSPSGKPIRKGLVAKLSRCCCSAGLTDGGTSALMEKLTQPRPAG